MIKSITKPILTGFMVLGLIIFGLLIAKHTIQPYVRSQLNYTSFIPEVKLSKQEAVSWTYLTSFTLATLGNREAYTSITWSMPYSTRMRIKYQIKLQPPKFYTCSYYECKQCRVYSYEYCSQYICTVQAGTPYTLCNREVTYCWKCTKQTTYNDYANVMASSAEAKDGPDLFDFWDADYIEISFTNGAKITDGFTKYQSIQVYLDIIMDNANQVVTEAKKYSDPFKVIFYFSDNTKYEYTVPSSNVEYTYWQGNDVSIKIPTYVIDQIKNKTILRIEVWENGGFDWSNFVDTGQKLSALINVWVTISDVLEMDSCSYNSTKQLESIGFTCTPSYTTTETKTFTGITDCSQVSYTNPNAKAYWKCPPDAYCKYPPKTVQVGTIPVTQTYKAATKTELYEKGCTDDVISCISYSTKSGTYWDYIKDESTLDARNPQCTQWDINTYNSATDKTKTTGEPPYVICTPKSIVSKTVVPYATCSGPTEDTVVQPLVLKVGDIEKKYYTEISDMIEFDVNPYSVIPIYLKGPSFQNFNLSGITTVSAIVEVMNENPYVVSDQVKDISPPDKSYKAIEYVATIHSPGNIYARFYPPICAQISDLKYVFAYLNGNPLPGDPCKGRGAILNLKKGMNEFKLQAYSIDPSQFSTCIKEPTTCQEEDIYGCPQQCKVQITSLTCPSKLIIYSNVAEQKEIPIIIESSRDGMVYITAEGRGLVPENKAVFVKAGKNTVMYNVSYYLYTTKPEKLTWRIIVQSPPLLRKDLSVIPETKSCEINVEVVQKNWSPIVEHPEIIIIAMVILVALFLYLRSLAS